MITHSLYLGVFNTKLPYPVLGSLLGTLWTLCGHRRYTGFQPCLHGSEPYVTVPIQCPEEHQEVAVVCYS